MASATVLAARGPGRPFVPTETTSGRVGRSSERSVISCPLLAATTFPGPERNADHLLVARLTFPALY